MLTVSYIQLNDNFKITKGQINFFQEMLRNPVWDCILLTIICMFIFYFRGNMEYVCKENNKCVIDVSRRNQCQACRLKRCLEVKMNKDGTPYHSFNYLFYFVKRGELFRMEELFCIFFCPLSQ